MAVWLVRAGKDGEFEQQFLEEGRIYLTWNRLAYDLAERADRERMRELLEQVYPEKPKQWIRSSLGQVWAFNRRMAQNDWIVLPSKSKSKSAIHVGKVKGDYVFNPNANDPFFHYRKIEWVVQDVPRTNFDQDLLYSFGSLLTICQISRNNAEQRIDKMAENGWKSTGTLLDANNKAGTEAESEDADSSEGLEDLVQAARDQLAKLIITRFQGHGMARLVDAVLRARDYTTYLSPPGPDKGIDILAAPEPMGFGEPRVCVQVKSGDSALDRPTLDQLIGVMQNVQASHGLLVSWGGFKSSVDKEEATQFFRVRLWDQGDLIDQVLAHYDKLDEEIRAELPLKRIWVVSEVAE